MISDCARWLFSNWNFHRSLGQLSFFTGAEMSSPSTKLIGARVTNGFCSTNEMLRIFPSIKYWILDGYSNVGDLLFLFPLNWMCLFYLLTWFYLRIFRFSPTELLRAMTARERSSERRRIEHWPPSPCLLDRQLCLPPLHYPVSNYLCVKMGNSKKLWWVSARLSSISLRLFS